MNECVIFQCSVAILKKINIKIISIEYHVFNFTISSDYSNQHHNLRG